MMISDLERLTRLIDLRARKDSFATLLLAFGMISVLLSIVPAYFGEYILSLSFTGLAVLFIVIALFPGYETTKIAKQINEEYGKPYEKIDFKKKTL